MAGIVVVGQAARDLVLAVEEWPEGGGAAAVAESLEMPGGKGLNQAVALQQLGEGPVALVAVVGDDQQGRAILEQLAADRVEAHAVVRRGLTALLVDVVDARGESRILEDVPTTSLLTEADVRQHADAFAGADTVCVQLEQPPETVALAARLGHEAGARVFLDGAGRSRSTTRRSASPASYARTGGRRGCSPASRSRTSTAPGRRPSSRRSTRIACRAIARRSGRTSSNGVRAWPPPRPRRT